MPSLAGLFARKKRPSPKSDTDSAISLSPTESKYLPSSPNGASTVYPGLVNASKLRLPFSRRKQQQSLPSQPASTTSVATDSTFSTPPRPSYIRSPRSSTSTADTDVDVRRLRPPPSKSAIFAAYADPYSALSTRSLPNESSSPPVPPKKPGFFKWSKSAPKTVPPPTDTSFNLKSFRHVGPPLLQPIPSTPTPTPTPPHSASLSLSPIPRTRGTSIDSSQRISVAAFREAQARRSTAGSPAPSLRAPSPALQPLYPQARPPERRRRSSGLAYSDADQSEHDDDDDDDAQGEETIRGRGLGNNTRRLVKARGTKSEMGHGTPVAATRAHSGLLVSMQSFGQGRQRASVSTSAVGPSLDARRANSIANHQSNPSSPVHMGFSPTQTTPHRPRTTSAYTVPRPPSSSSSSSADSEDDAPLATLVPPRRPGSARSSLSASSIARPKPLIDINELTGGAGGREREMSRGRERERDKKGMDGFTGGRTLLASPASASVSVGSGGIGEEKRVGGPVKVSVSPPRRFVSPPASPKGATVGLGVEGGETERERERERDGIGERLNRALGVAGGARQGMGRASTTATAKKKTTTIVKVRSSTSVAASTSTGTSASASTSASAGVKPVVVVPPQRLSTPVDDLALLLGGGVNLIRRTEGESESESESESGDEDDEDAESMEKRRGKGQGDVKGKGKEKEKPIAPIPIRQRAPPPSFSVTSRPPLNRNSGVEVAFEKEKEKQKGSVFANNNTTTTSASATKPVGILNFPSGRGAERDGPLPPPMTRPGPRQRSSTLVPGSVSVSSLSPIPSTSTSASVTSTSTSNSTGDSDSVQGQTQAQGQQGMGRYSLNNLHALKNLGAHTHTHSHPHTHPHNHPHSHKHTMSMGSTSGSTIGMPPSRPFAGGRRESPAGSSTGDSSSGRAPVTPRDGSEIGVGVGMRNVQRRSVSFEEDLRKGNQIQSQSRGRGVGVGVGVRGESGDVDEDEEGEMRRRERRRSEAKAAIELGNVINGRGPIVDEDDDDDDLPINQTVGGSQGRRMSSLNPMMGAFGSGLPGWNMNMNMHGVNMNPMNISPMNVGMSMSPGMMSPADPGYIAAHQQAMMFAKQAYQMAVAQQAMAAAGDEWERGSTFGGAGGTAAASVYGGSTSPSVVGSPPFMMGMGMNMMGMGMGVGGVGNGWSTAGSVVFPGSARSMYGGISGSRSEYGGAGGAGAGKWSSSKSSYGDYGSSAGAAGGNKNSKVIGGRDSGYFPPVPPVPAQHSHNGSAASSVRSAGALRARTASQPATPSKGARRAPPPSSWRAGGI